MRCTRRRSAASMEATLWLAEVWWFKRIECDSAVLHPGECRSELRPSFQQRAIPSGKIRPGLVGTLRELQNFGTRRACPAHIVIRQQKFFQLSFIKRGRGAKWLSATACWFRGNIAVKHWALDISAARPPANTCTFVGIGLRGYDALSRRRWAPTETSAT